MIGKNYELIEHTADIGIRVRGSDLEGLFISAAEAMFDIIAEKKPNTQYAIRNTQYIIQQKADNLEELFINWLNELLSLAATKELIFSEFQINKLDENNIEAIAIGPSTENFRVNVEIKAATYHQLKLEKIGADWQAEVIFDV